MQITADTVTDEQIRQLRDSIPDDGGINAARRAECDWALSRGAGFVSDAARDDLENRRLLARARCADLINARGSK